MSFLDKLGDFTGGFGEGLSGTILPAFEKGWDRQTKLLDKAENRDYAEGVRESDREYNEHSRILWKYANEGDVSAISSYLDDPSIPPNLQALIPQHLEMAQQFVGEKVNNALRSGAVSQERVNIVVGDKNYKDLKLEGVNPEQLHEYVNTLAQESDALEALLNDPNVSLEDKARIEETRNALDTDIQKYFGLSTGFKRWASNTGEEFAQLEELMGTDAYIPELDRLSPELTDAQYKTRYYRNARQVVDKLLERTDVEGARAFVRTLPPNSTYRPAFESLVDNYVEDVEEGTLSGLIENLSNNSNQIAYMELYDFTEQDPDESSLTPVQQKTHQLKMKLGSDNILKRQRALFGAAIKVADKEIGEYLNQRGTSIGASKDAAMFTMRRKRQMNFLRKSATDHGLEPWIFDREDWESLFDADGGRERLGINYAKFLKNSMRFGAISRDDAVNRIETEEWLTVAERLNARTELDLSPPQGLVVDPTLRNFDITAVGKDIGQSIHEIEFTEIDNMEIKQKIAKAMSGAGRYNLDDTFSEIKDQIRGKDNTISNEFYRNAAIIALEELQEKLTSNDGLEGWEDSGTGDRVPYVSPPQTTQPKRQGGNNVTRNSLMGKDYLSGETVDPKNVMGQSKLLGTY